MDAVYLPISGGVDSRVLLACSKPVLDKVQLFSHATNMMSRKDTRIARLLAAKLDLDILIIDPLKDDPDRVIDTDWLAREDKALNIVDGRSMPTIEHEVHSALPKGGLVLRGNVADFLKAVLWRRGVQEFINEKPHIPSTGIKMMMLGDANLKNSDTIRTQYEAWYAEFEGVARNRAFDLMFAEQFLSHGLGNSFYGLRNNFYICPFNDRSLVAAATGLSPYQRRQLKYTDVIIETLAPELLDIGYTRDSTNRRRHARSVNEQ